MDLPDPPEGWKLRTLTEVCDNEWFVQLVGPGEYVNASGSTARYAIAAAIVKIEEGITFERLSGMQPTTVDLVKALGIRSKPTDVRRI